QQQNQIINTPPEAHQPPAAIPFSRGTPTTLAAPFSASRRGGHPHPGHRNRPPQQPLTPATLEHHGKIEFVKTNPENPTTLWYFRKPPPGPKLISSFRPAPRWHKTIYAPDTTKSNRVKSAPERGVTAGKHLFPVLADRLVQNLDPCSVALATSNDQPSAVQQVPLARGPALISDLAVVDVGAAFLDGS